MISIQEAKELVGKVCAIRWNDRAGKEHLVVSKIYDATFVPLYGGYLVTDVDDIRLDRVCSVALQESEAAVVTAAPEHVAA